jgi:hypothetical protein
MGLDRSRFIGAYDVSYGAPGVNAQRYGVRAYAELSRDLSCPDVQMALDLFPTPPPGDGCGLRKARCPRFIRETDGCGLDQL